MQEPINGMLFETVRGPRR